MNLRWLLGNFTDPQYNIPRREQFRLSNEAHKKFVSTSAFLWHTFLILLPFLVLLKFLNPLMTWLGFTSQAGPYLIAYAILVILFWIWSAWMYRSLYVRPIRRAMRATGYDLCINCGYELRGLDASIAQCPECGQDRETANATRSDARTEAGHRPK